MYNMRRKEYNDFLILFFEKVTDNFLQNWIILDLLDYLGAGYSNVKINIE